MNIDKAFKISLIFGVLSLSISFSYLFFIKPLLKEKKMALCIERVEEEFIGAKNDLESKQRELFSQRSKREDEKQKLERRERELLDQMNNEISIPNFKDELTKRIDKKTEQLKEQATDIEKWAIESNHTVNYFKKLAEDQVYKDYYMENSEYKVGNEELSKLRKEIAELNEQVDELHYNESISALDKKLDDDKSDCLNGINLKVFIR